MALLAMTRRMGAVLIALSGLGLTALPASAADMSFDATYRVSISGLELGQAVVSGQFDGADYRIDGRGKLTGLAGALMEYKGSASAAGRLGRGGTLPSAFSVDATDGKKMTKVRMTLVGDNVRRIALEPPLRESEHPARVAVTESHKRGIIDPMSALMILGAMGDGQLDPSVCKRTFPVFNGRERFDIVLAYKERREISEPGYRGPAVVCEARYRPISGHRSDKDEVKYFASRAAEVIYVPVPGADLALPYRLSVPTPIGTGSIVMTALKAEGALRTKAASLTGR
ncbi:DUF3108 domain-containing protein [Lutibaculum baratangense]|uniref:DUF3108 domain-containing protein n=1 Tax=Lutibaculum baratangense AMV1 TaxID=631454 RepID=V4RLJ4_9HYPH|nr:DUF3108 domain-containing protein [Lutibaculum baratangense]ESR24115.1 hypothetical protein N177_2564 [Lutibaculum baratangense AMV1]